MALVMTFAVIRSSLVLMRPQNCSINLGKVVALITVAEFERPLTKSVSLFEEPDLRYLVENIWNSQNVLSAHEDLFDLILVRGCEWG